MDKLMTCVFVLSLLLAPVSCTGSMKELFSEPVVCYVLDGILVIYCVLATALFFKEKLSCAESQSVEENCNIYQELGTNEPEPYQVLEPTKTKKKIKKKKKSKPAKVETDEDQRETLTPTTEPPPVLPKCGPAGSTLTSGDSTIINEDDTVH